MAGNHQRGPPPSTLWVSRDLQNPPELGLLEACAPGVCRVCPCPRPRVSLEMGRWGHSPTWEPRCLWVNDGERGRALTAQPSAGPRPSCALGGHDPSLPGDRPASPLGCSPSLSPGSHRSRPGRSWPLNGCKGLPHTFPPSPSPPQLPQLFLTTPSQPPTRPTS